MKNLRTFSLVLLVLASVGLGCSTISKLRSGIEEGPANGTGTASNSNSASPSSPAESEPGSVTAGADPKAEIVAASKKFISLPFFTAKVDSGAENGLKLTIEYQAPDRYRIVGPVVHGLSSEVIYIGGDAYMKLGSKWEKSPAGNAMKSPMQEIISEKSLAKLSDVKYEGTETLDGTRAFKYSYENPEDPSKQMMAYSSTIWINAASGLPMKIKVNYKGGELKAATIDYDTNTPVTIDKPI